VGAWGDGGGSRVLGPGVVLGGPSGWCPCWDPFWCGRVAAAAHLALGVAVPPQSLCPDRGAMQEILFVDEEEEDGSYRASAVAAAIHTEKGITGLETPPR
jgi:hypothetical protein